MTVAPPPRTEDKVVWRRWSRTLPAVGSATARAVSDHLVAFLADVDDPVLTYVALPDEVDIDRVGSPGVLRAGVALPRIDSDGRLTVHLDDGMRERHRTGIHQPTLGHDAVDPAVLGAVLVPGRVFDRAGFRLGRGGGHYDRLLPNLDPIIPVVGVTCLGRIVDRLPREDHDRPMTHLVTEDGVVSTT